MNAPGTPTPVAPARRLTLRAYLRRWRRWWLLPLVASAALFLGATAAFLSSSVPFIYTIF